MRIARHVSVLMMAVAAAVILVGVFSRGGATETNAQASIGSATFAVANLPGSNPAVGADFTGTVDLTSFTPGTSATWGGYDLELGYDTTVLSVNTVTGGLCSGAAFGNPSNSPAVVAGCFLQSRSDTGTLVTISFHCIMNGTSPLTIVARPGVTALGSALFDEVGTDFVMTLNSSSIACGSANTPTPTNTVPPTDTPVPTNTVAATNTATPTNTATGAQATSTAQSQSTSSAATQTAQANFGGQITATPTSVPGSPTATSTTAGGTTPPPGATQPGGGQGGAGGTPTRPTGITGPNTGTGGSGGSSLPSMALVIAGILLAVTGGGLFVAARRVR